MARGHWLDPFARRLLEAAGQLPPRPAVPATPAVAALSPEAPGGSDPEIERDLLELRLRQQPQHRLRSADEAQHAAALGWRLDVNRASTDDWLRLPGIQPGQVDLLLRLQQGGVQLSDGLPASPAPSRLDLNRSSAAQLEQQLPQLTAERRARLLRERQRQPFQDLADLQQRLQLPPALVEELIGRVRFSQGQAGPQLPRSA